MKSVKYEKPNMIFINLKNMQAIADADGPCLGTAAGKNGNTQFYYDVPGNGWISIVTPSNCSAKVDECEWEYKKNHEGELPSEEIINKAILEAKLSLETNKQVFSGAYHDPLPSWS